MAAPHVHLEPAPGRSHAKTYVWSQGGHTYVCVGIVRPGRHRATATARHTPDQARELARALLDAADQAEHTRMLEEAAA